MCVTCDVATTSDEHHHTSHLTRAKSGKEYFTKCGKNMQGEHMAAHFRALTLRRYEATSRCLYKIANLRGVRQLQQHTNQTFHIKTEPASSFSSAHVGGVILVVSCIHVRFQLDERFTNFDMTFRRRYMERSLSPTPTRQSKRSK